MGAIRFDTGLVRWIVSSLLLAAFTAAMLVATAGTAAAQAVDDCYPIPEDGCVLGVDLEARVLGPVCEDEVPYLEWDLHLDTPDDVAVTVTFVNPDGDDLVYRDQQLQGRILWPGAELDADGRGTNWPGWEFQDGNWVEVDDGFAFTRDDVLVRFEAGEASYEANVPYPPPTSACADPTDVRGVVIERPDGAGGGTGTTGTTGSTATGGLRVGSAILPVTGMEALALGAIGIGILGAGIVLVMRSRRRASEDTVHG